MVKSKKKTKKSKSKQPAREINVLGHVLVPDHIPLSAKESKEVLERYKITKDQLPKIRISDPAIVDMDRGRDEVKEGSIVKIIRQSKTAGESIAYRLVIGG